MKNIIGYSLWGTHPMYWKGALINIDLVNKYYPGFKSRFYINNDSDPDLIKTIKGKNVEIELVNPTGEFGGMFSRFAAAEEKDVNIFMSRDCDSRISQREVSAVQEWLNSDKDFHIMRDHPWHSVAILGGMWACRNGILRDINLMGSISKWKNHSIKGCDQDFLGQIIYPLIKDKSMEHSEFNLRYGGEIRPFPHIRNNYEFVGDVFDENEARHPDYWRFIKNLIG